MKLNVVVLAWTDGKGFRVSLTFRFWKKPLWRADKGHSYFAFDNTRHQTKNELAIEMLDWAHATGFKPAAVLFDAAFLSEHMVKYLKFRDWHFVSRIKGNRHLTRAGKLFRPKDWEREANTGQTPGLGRALLVTLPGWGPVRVIATRLASEGGKLRFLVGSNPNWGRGRIAALYGHRWQIECLFRDGKQLAGLEDCHCRKWRAQENHFALAMLALVFIADQSRRLESSADALDRLGNRPIALAAAPVPAKVRSIKLERRRKRQSAHPVRRSARSA